MVYWPAVDAFKIGSTAHRRYRSFLTRGGQLLDTVSFENGSDCYAFESVCHLVLNQSGARSVFKNAAESEQFLGGNGGGYMECYQRPKGVLASELPDYLDALLADFSHA
jgi:hypothetical protein